MVGGREASDRRWRGPSGAFVGAVGGAVFGAFLHPHKVMPTELTHFLTIVLDTCLGAMLGSLIVWLDRHP